MKILYSALFLFFSLKLFATNIESIDMDGMSVGDSLLEHYSLEYLDNNSSKKYYTESDSFYSLSLMSNDNSEFDYYIFHLKTGDDEYIYWFC